MEVEEILKENDSEKLLEYCSKYDIPSEFRGKVWIKLLNVELVEEDLNNKDVLEHFTEKYKEISEDEKKVYKIVNEFENITQIEKYSLFESITKRYFYKFKHFECFCLLFRLILLYHDPKLCLNFDSNSIEPIEYIQSFIFNNFLNLTDEILYLWDTLLINSKNKLFPIFFGIGYLIKKREKNLLIKKDLNVKMNKIQNLIEIIEIQKIGKEIEMRTPLSTKNQLMSLLFPTKETNLDELFQFFKKNLILPIPTFEIIEGFLKKKKVNTLSNNYHQNYIIIDCRSIESFKFARIPTAIHIGSNIKYDENKIKKIINQFESAKDSHFTIFGTGRNLEEEDNFLKLIAMKFIKNDFKHISIAYEGFKGCIKYISTNEIEFVHDDKNDKNNEENESIFSTIKNYSSDLFAKWKMKNEDIENKSLKKESQNETNFNSNFSLDDTEMINNDLIDENDSKLAIKIENISKINHEKLTLFNGRNEENTFYLLFDSKMIMLLRAHPNEFGIGLFEWKKLLKQLKKVTISKLIKNQITLDFGDFKQELILNECQTFLKFINTSI
eukprot:gene4226-7563_t